MLLDRRPVLSVCRLSVCLSVCDVRALWPNGYTDQDETWHAGRPRPGHIVLDGDRALPPPKGHPQFSAHICCGQMAGWIKMPLGMEEKLGPGDAVLDGDAAPPSQKGGAAPSPIFGPCPLWPNGWMYQDGTWHRSGLWSRLHCARLGPRSPPQTAGCINKMPLGMEVGLSPASLC